MTIMIPENEAVSSILARIETNEKQLKVLQQTCKDLMIRRKVHTNKSILDGNESNIENKFVDTAADETKISLKKSKEGTTLLWRTLRMAIPFYLVVIILCAIEWLEPQCCDMQNNYKWSFTIGLRHINGPPPT